MRKHQLCRLPNLIMVPTRPVTASQSPSPRAGCRVHGPVPFQPFPSGQQRSCFSARGAGCALLHLPRPRSEEKGARTGKAHPGGLFLLGSGVMVAGQPRGACCPCRRRPIEPGAGGECEGPPGFRGSRFHEHSPWREQRSQLALNQRDREGREQLQQNDASHLSRCKHPVLVG